MLRSEERIKSFIRDNYFSAIFENDKYNENAIRRISKRNFENFKLRSR